MDNLRHKGRLWLFLMAWGLMAPADASAQKATVWAPITLKVKTDKCMYSPGETVAFTLTSSKPDKARVRIRHGMEVVADWELASSKWNWTAPQTDFRGYLADIYTTDNEGNETIHATIGIDVSSTWNKFPRYGFVDTYDDSKRTEQIKSEMQTLNRLHINGVQFYDWHWKHHIPLCGTREEPAVTYKDIANRKVNAQALKDYISVQHGYGMKAMFYNLLYGAQPNSEADGVDYTWGLFSDTRHSVRDYHGLPDGWAGPIYLCDPANTNWQDYLAERNDDVYAAYGFDGFHIDQLGYRGNRYDYNGNRLNLPDGYASFIRAMKARHPDKHLVMNAVGDYGASEIIGTGNVDFAYTEMWDGNRQFSDIEQIARSHFEASNPMPTVFAAYMNYGLQNTQGPFNEPGILLTDATMFAVGGAHIEMGDHMLCSEYFPNSNRQLTGTLMASLTSYYDFLTAYEHLLRGGGAVGPANVSSGRQDVAVNAWPPVMGSVATYARQKGNCKVIQLLNYRQADQLSWRDLNGTMPEPQEITQLPLRIAASDITRVWVASPDNLGGAPQEIAFEKDGDYICCTVPRLKYWTMVVLEQGQRTPMVVGDATWGGWNPENASVMVAEPGLPDVFSYTGHLEADKEFKFITKNGWDGDEYRNANATDPYIYGKGRIRLGGSDDKFKVKESANYTIHCNLADMTVSVEKAAFQQAPISHNMLYLVGDATPGNWTLANATPLTQDHSNPFRFTGYAHLTASGSFKIAVNNHASWGQKFYFRDATDSRKVSEDATGDRQWTVPADDDYTVTVDLEDMTISMVSSTGISAIPAHADSMALVYSPSDRSLLCSLPENCTAAELTVCGFGGTLVKRMRLPIEGGGRQTTASIGELCRGHYVVTLYARTADGTTAHKTLKVAEP